MLDGYNIIWYTLLVQVPNRHEKWSKDDQKMKQNRPN